MCKFHEYPKPAQFIYQMASGFYPDHLEEEGHQSKEPLGIRLKEHFLRLGYTDEQIRQFFKMAQSIEPEDSLGEIRPSCRS